MKISSLIHKIKGTPLWFAFWAGAFAGCAPVVATAPFPERPDSTQAGDLLGPFDGRVVDASSGKPLSGALFFASWGFETGRGLTAPAGGWTETGETDAEGRYTIRRLRAVPGSRTRVVRFTLIVYKRGYLGYRSDRRFDDLSERHDFAQHLNLAKLDRFSAQTSHVRHLRFLGGGAPLKRAIDREFVEASLELSEPQVAATGPLLDAGLLLSIEELRAQPGLHAAGAFTVERLGDLPQTTTYDSRHFRAVDKPESFDAAIRIWKLPSAAQAEVRYDSIAREMPHAEIRDEMGDRSLRGIDGKIMAAATLDRERGTVLELTCGVDLCGDADHTAALLRRVLGHADRVGREAGGEAETPEPEKPQRLEQEPMRLRPPELKR